VPKRGDFNSWRGGSRYHNMPAIALSDVPL